VTIVTRVSCYHVMVVGDSGDSRRNERFGRIAVVVGSFCGRTSKLLYIERLGLEGTCKFGNERLVGKPGLT